MFASTLFVFSSCEHSSEKDFVLHICRKAILAIYLKVSLETKYYILPRQALLLKELEYALSWVIGTTPCD